MNIQIVRQRFSTFLKQFRIEDLKLLMKFLEIIVSEYKNSRASRLFDLLSETSNIDIDEYDLGTNELCDDQDDQNHSMENVAKKIKLNRYRTNSKIQSEKYRRFKLLDARKRSINSLNNANSDPVHFKSITNGNISDTNGIGDASNTDAKKSLSPANEETSPLQTSINTDTKDANNSETNFEETEQDQEVQRESDDMGEAKYAANRPHIRMMDSSSKKPYRPQVQRYNDAACYNGNNDRNSNFGINNEHSNQSMSYLDEESIDRMFETNSADEYIENNPETAMSTYGAQKNSRWMLKQASMPLDSGILMSSISGSIVKGVTKCAVCSDTASGTRYGVCVCEGCKEFFRRQRENSGNRSLYCVNGTNNCPINMNNRTQCRKCRLEKCLKLGMKLVGK